MPVEEALVRIGLETQFFCSANPAGWDPLYGKSPVHFAGEIHKSALAKALAGIGLDDLLPTDTAEGSGGDQGTGEARD